MTRLLAVAEAALTRVDPNGDTIKRRRAIVHLSKYMAGFILEPVHLRHAGVVRRSPLKRFAWIGILCGCAVGARAQDQGPMAAPPKFEVNRIPAVPHPGPPPIPVEQIIQKFAANEDLMKKAFDTYDFNRTVRVEELDDSGGKLTVSGPVVSLRDGHFWRVKGQLQSTLTTMRLSLEEVREMITFPAFVLTTGEIGNYNFLYAGQDKLDELNTYVFQVKPKQLSRTRLFFEGAIWVDDHDLAIVKTYGKFVSDASGNGPNRPFKMYETYRQNFQEKYWLPTYTNSDDYVDNPDKTQTHLRLVIRDTDFKPASADAATSAPAAAPGAGSTPASSPDNPTPNSPPAAAQPIGQH